MLFLAGGACALATPMGDRLGNAACNKNQRKLFQHGFWCVLARGQHFHDFCLLGKLFKSTFFFLELSRELIRVKKSQLMEGTLSVHVDATLLLLQDIFKNT